MLEQRTRASGSLTERAPMFHLERVGKRYPGTVALEPIDLAIKHGERVALMGPSGSGKSTLLKILAGIIRPDSGELRIDGHDSHRLQPGRELSRLVGIMPQSLDLILPVAVAHNVNAGKLGEWGFFRSLFSLISPLEIGDVQQALTRVGIPDKIHERTSHLSGGEQQRVALARLLVQKPRAIIADEPVASVDPARASDLIALMIALADENEQTLITSLHSVPLAMTWFSRVIAMRHGRIVFDRSPDKIHQHDLDALYLLEDGRDAIG